MDKIKKEAFHKSLSGSKGIGTRKEVGQTGEVTAVAYLRRKGYEILDVNYRTPWGEIDLIARDKSTLVFVEVKTKTTPFYGDPLDAVTLFKKNHLIKAALWYVGTRQFKDMSLRFDAVGIGPHGIRHDTNIITDNEGLTYY